MASSSALATSVVESDGGPAHLLRELCEEPLGHLVQRPAPDDVERRVGHARRRAPPRIGEHVDRLVALEHPDEERQRPRRERRGFGLREGLEVHERRELGGRLDPRLAHEP